MDVENMDKRKSFGLYFFAAGILILVVYAIYLFIQEIEISQIDVIIAIGSGAIIIGLIIMMISIFFEQHSDIKKMKEEIKKEDLEP
jgi:hypothetical protein